MLMATRAIKVNIPGEVWRNGDENDEDSVLANGAGGLMAASVSAQTPAGQAPAAPAPPDFCVDAAPYSITDAVAC